MLHNLYILSCTFRYWDQIKTAMQEKHTQNLSMFFCCWYMMIQHTSTFTDGNILVYKFRRWQKYILLSQCETTKQLFYCLICIQATFSTLPAVME
jgi:hypothetical protein